MCSSRAVCQAQTCAWNHPLVMDLCSHWLYWFDADAALSEGEGSAQKPLLWGSRSWFFLWMKWIPEKNQPHIISINPLSLGEEVMKINVLYTFQWYSSECKWALSYFCLQRWVLCSESRLQDRGKGPPRKALYSLCLLFLCNWSHSTSTAESFKATTHFLWLDHSTNLKYSTRVSQDYFLGMVSYTFPQNPAWFIYSLGLSNRF